MNKNCARAMWLNWYLPRYWRFYVPCIVSALLLSATGTPAATLTVTNGNDSGPGSLRQAILNASSGDTINFAPVVRTINLNSGELVIDKNLTITGPGADRLTVRRSTNSPQFRIFHITTHTATVFIVRLTISNGAVEDDGGGIRNAGVLTVTNSIISGNQAAGTEFVGGNGGGVLNEGRAMTITRCTISNNSAQYSTGSSGDSPFSSGGGILNYSGGSLTVTNSTISGNSCSINDFFGINPGGGGGGGISNAGSMTITNCTISGNSVSGNGLSPMDGGGISNGGNLQIKSSTIAYNSASGDNGAFGGGIYGSGTTDSSIIALNNAPTGPDFTGGGGLQSMGYNIIGNNADGVINSRSTDQIGTPGAPINPLLGPLADNGGLTLTHALQPGSPAINRGDPAAPPQDQRGYGRVGVPDVGAFELGAIGPRYDFNGDGKPDFVLYNGSTRGTVIWYLNNNVYVGGAVGPSLGVGWSLRDVADFNGDHKPDYALFNAISRQTEIWYLNNNVFVRGASGPTLPAGWTLLAVADFNGDGKPDFVLYHATTRATAIWYLNNNVFVRGASGPTLPAGWTLRGVADFNGDRKPDFALYNAATGATAIWYLNNNVFIRGASGPTLPAGWALHGVADFNGDGKPDFVLYHATTRATAIWYLNNNVFVRAASGPTLPAGWGLAAP